MASQDTQLFPIDVTAGVSPNTDTPPASTPHFTFTKAIRFVDGLPEKIGGWVANTFEDNATIDGIVRSIYSQTINTLSVLVLGTAQKLYALYGGQLTNITPLQTTSVAAPNSLGTLYQLLANNPLTTTAGDTLVTVADTASGLLRAGDLITLSGAPTGNGIPASEINKEHSIRSIGVNSYTILVTTAPTSSGSYGGASVLRTSGLIRLTNVAHGLTTGMRVKIEGATDVAGILAVQINKEHIIRVNNLDNFDIFTTGLATASVSGAGGASTVYYEQIAEGEATTSPSEGYGVGLYGVGLYGVAAVSDQSVRLPRIWFFDAYGENIITTPGNGTGVYTWDGSTETAPTLIPNAPTEVNYAFVYESRVIVLGAGGVKNAIDTSDVGDITQWTASSSNEVYSTDVFGADRLICHASVTGGFLIFSERQTYFFQYVGRPVIFDLSQVSNVVGAISPRAAVSVNGTAFWMGRDNFYVWSGGSVQIIPANTGTQCTALRYVFDNLNYGQAYNIFGWYNNRFNEIWWHYPCLESTEADFIIRLSLTDYSWTIDQMNRSAAESPNNRSTQPILADGSILYEHENGNNDGTSGLSFQLTTNLRKSGVQAAQISEIWPESIQTGNISVNVKGYVAAQSASPVYEVPLTVTPTTETLRIDKASKFWQYDISGNAIDQKFDMGIWYEQIQGGRIKR